MSSNQIEHESPQSTNLNSEDQVIPDKICIPLFSHLEQRRVAAHSSLLQQQLLRHLDNCQRFYRGLASL